MLLSGRSPPTYWSYMFRILRLSEWWLRGQRPSNECLSCATLRTSSMEANLFASDIRALVILALYSTTNMGALLLDFILELRTWHYRHCC